MELLLAGITLSALPTGAVLLRPARPLQLPPARSRAADADDRPKGGHPALDSLARAAVVVAAFRVSRKEAVVAYNPERTLSSGAPAAAPQQPRPQLALSGIVWGGQAKPMAVLEGLPGIQGPRVLQLGERVGGLTVRRIKGDVVTVTGLDTTWTLRVKEPWK
jgi:hypothetical protein